MRRSVDLNALGYDPTVHHQLRVYQVLLRNASSETWMPTSEADYKFIMKNTGRNKS